MISKFIVVIITMAAAGCAFACDSDSSPTSTATPTGVVIDSISPSAAAPGTEIVIDGSGFTPEDNDIGLTHEDIDFQGSRIAFLNGIPSPDGVTLTFDLPDTNDIPLAACSYSQLGPDEACPDIGLLLPSGEVEVAIFNGEGTSNSFTFTVLDLETRPTTTPETVMLERISPTSAAPGTEIVIEGSGFTPEDNDIAFTHQDIDFQGSHSGYLNDLSSEDGKTITFELRDTLGACAFSQLGPDGACEAIGLLLPSGAVEVSVFNANGQSNSITFTVLESE